MQIAVIGGGNIGGTLGRAWAAAGHTVIYGARDPAGAKAAALVGATGGASRAAGVGEAIAAAEVALLAVPAAALGEIAAAHGAAMAGRLLIDATNRFGAPVVNGLAELAAHVPGATLARAFNALGWENFATPQIGGAQVDLFFCAPDGPARATVAALGAAIGLRPIWVGGLEQAPVVDALGTLWVQLAFRQGLGRRIALRLLQE